MAVWCATPGQPVQSLPVGQRTPAEQVLFALKNSVSLVMSYGPAEIAHMIPETTPTTTNWTPSPVSDRGFPHGDWSWSLESPDVIVDRATGRVFPNDEFPEDIVVTATVGARSNGSPFTAARIGSLTVFRLPHRLQVTSGLARFSTWPRRWRNSV